MSQRLTSLDVFRGMTIFFMIIVNTTGSWSTTYAPLLHAKWHGFTPTDLVFPSFLFAVGASLAIVMPRLRRNKSRTEIYGKILKRTAIIFFLGYFLSWFPFTSFQADGSLGFKPFESTRFMGVLQRIALCYGIAAMLVYHFSAKQVLYITAGILLGYWFLLTGFGDYSMTGNFGHWLDLKIIGENHLYKGEGVPFDPEGLLSTLPAVGNVTLGFATVHYLRARPKDRIMKWQLTLIAGALVAAGCLWHYGFPINKKIWTSSYVLLTSGISMWMLLGLHFLLDKKGVQRNWANFFLPMGKNPLLIYVLSGVLAKLLYWLPSSEYGNAYGAIYNTVFKNAGDYFGAFLFALTFTMICWVAALLLDRRGWYLRV